MGQLERYGLYVLVLIIFLILGVAIWGDDPQDLTPKTSVHEVRDKLGERPSEPLSVSGRDASGGRDASVSEAYRGHFELDPWRDTEARKKVADDVPIFVAESGPKGMDLLGDLQSAKAEPAVERSDVDPAPASGLPDLRVHVIAKGDILGKLAQRYLGSSRHVDAILALNPRVDPKRMPVGTKLRIPHSDETLAKFGRPTRGDLKKSSGTSGARPASTESKAETYVVKDGDSAWKISKRLYGTPRHMYRILKANGLKKSAVLTPGSVLRLPKIEED